MSCCLGFYWERLFKPFSYPIPWRHSKYGNHCPHLRRAGAAGELITSSGSIPERNTTTSPFLQLITSLVFVKTLRVIVNSFSIRYWIHVNLSEYLTYLTTWGYRNECSCNKLNLSYPVIHWRYFTGTRLSSQSLVGLIASRFTTAHQAKPESG